MDSGGLDETLTDCIYSPNLHLAKTFAFGYI
jgi:hypothetical protein